MKNLFLALAVLLSCGLAHAERAADSGAVSEKQQVWKGKKILLDRKIVDSTLTGATSLYKDSRAVQRMDPGGSNRNVTLPAVGDSEGLEFFIINSADAAENLVIKNAGATTIVTIAQNEAGYVFCDGATWYGFAFSNASSGFLPASGATAGATSQAQDFGTNGIKADNIISSSGTTTTFNLKLTDNLADALNIKEASNSYLKFVTTNSGEKVTVSKRLDVANALASTPGTVQDMSTAGTITLPTAGFTQRLTSSGGASTGVILTAGSFDGQILVLLNADAANDITFAASGTSHVAGGTSCKVDHLYAAYFIYDNTTSLWYQVKP